MSFVNALKDYLEHINSLSNFDHFTFFSIIKSSVFFFLYSLKLGFLYLIQFKWLTDFIELPAVFKYEYAAILEGKNVFVYDLETQLDQNFFLFSDQSILNSTNFSTGFVNSFFLTLPFSVAHLLTIRTFLINGLPAGISAATGTIVGQFLFFSCILFGFEFIILPFLNFEPLTILLGFFLLINLFYKIIHKPNFSLIGIYQKNELLKIFGLNFFLVWVEQACILGFFGNLTLHNSPGLLQTSETTNFFFTQVSYLSGLLLGNIWWTCIFTFGLFRLRNWIANKIAFNISFISLNKKIHYSTLFLMVILSFNTIPYYGFDYIFYNGLGFVQNDIALNKITSQPYKAIRIKKSDIEFTMNPLPFDTLSSQKNYPSTFRSGLKYEHYNLPSEYLWQNKTNLRRGSDPKTSTKNQDLDSFKFPDVNIQPLTQYETNNLNTESNKNLKFSALDHVINYYSRLVFRKDVYKKYKADKANPSYVPGKFTKVHRQFREKYYSNPVYKVLLNFNLYAFLTGQPINYNLTSSDESDLYNRRIILQNYLDTILDYKTNNKTKRKSYAEKVYNQQFKGSLSVIRHFSAINTQPDLKTNSLALPSTSIFTDQNEKKILKYDQQLYNEKEKKANWLLHEELEPDLNTSSADDSTALILNNSTPFYIGWDNGLRKFLIKTAVISNQMVIGDSVSSNPNIENLNAKQINHMAETNLGETSKNNPNYFNFQSWSPSATTMCTLNTLSDSSVFLTFSNGKGEEGKQGLKEAKKNSSTIVKPVLELDSNNSYFLKNGFQFAFKDPNVIFMSPQQINSTTNEILTSLPNVNQRWWPKSAKTELNIEKSLPPSFDGIAWPVSTKSILYKQLSFTFNEPFSSTFKFDLKN